MDLIIPVFLYSLWYYCIVKAAAAGHEEFCIRQGHSGFSPQEGDPTGLNPVDDPTSTAMMMDMGEL